MAQALAAYLEADRVLYTCALTDAERLIWEAKRATAMSIVFFN